MVLLVGIELDELLREDVEKGEPAIHELVRSFFYGRLVPRPRGAFGDDEFGRAAERAARFFGTPRYIIGQTLVVIAWIALNSLALIGHWDPYPFILLNLAFSTQAAYAAPLILLAQTRQAERDKLHGETVEKVHAHQLATATRHEREIRQAVAELRELLESNTTLTQQDTELTQQVAALTREIHARVTTP